MVEEQNDDIKFDPVVEAAPEVEEFKPSKKTTTPPAQTAATNKAQVTIVPGSFRERHYICVAGDGTGYWVPEDRIPGEGQDKSFSIDLADKEIKLLYNWTKEIEAMLPSKTEMIANVRKALWLNGALDKESLKLSAVQRNLMRGAFPYRLETEEE